VHERVFAIACYKEAVMLIKRFLLAKCGEAVFHAFDGVVFVVD
jgi:hypothetical protein